MTEVFDAPVVARVLGGSVAAVTAGTRAASILRPRRYDLSGARQEQLRRARIVAAAAGRKFPEKAAAEFVARLARHLPGLRYTAGLATYCSLAPHSTVAPPKSLIGRPLNSVKWTPEGKLVVLETVFGHMHTEGVFSVKDALKALGRTARADNKLPTIKPAKGRQLIHWSYITPARFSQIKAEFRANAAPFLAEAERCGYQGKEAEVIGWLQFLRSGGTSPR